jgi:hypothetical protein
VPVIFSLCYPLQISGGIVFFVSVDMVYLRLVVRVIYKSFGYQLMHYNCFANVALAQTYMLISIGICIEMQKTVGASNSPLITDLI